MIYLTRIGVCIDYGLLVKKIGCAGVRQIKSIFTIITPGHNNTKKTICSFKLIGVKDADETKSRMVMLPRFGGFMIRDTCLLPAINNKLQIGECAEFTDTQMKLTNNQNAVLKYLQSTVYTQDNIIEGTSSTILQMDPGYGKTYLAMGVIRYIKRKTFIIVPNTYLLRQWVEILTITFPNNTIGCYYGVKKIDGDIVVSIINSALKYPHYEKCGLVIYDEVHMYCSNKFADIFTKAQSSCCLGITATPSDRIDKFDPVAAWALGKIIYADKIPGWNSADVNFDTTVTRVIYNGHKDYTKIIESASGIVSVPLMVNQLQEDPYRNKLIIAYAIKLYNLGRNVFIFSDRRDHLHTLAKILQGYEIIFDAPELDDEKKTHTPTGITELMGGSTDRDIEHAKNTGRVILTTYQYSGTGVSINKMNSLILATPRKSNMKQILGRIYRLTSDATIMRHVIDLVDNRVCMKSQYYTRKKTYINKLQAHIHDRKFKWQECTDIKKINVF